MSMGLGELGEVAGISKVMLGKEQGEGQGLPGLLIENPHCRATVALQGAQILDFQAAGQRPLLWLSERALLTPGKAIRGGIPLCFPWFGSHPQDASKPAHGFARNREWQLSAASLGEQGHTLVFTLNADAATRALWPHDFRAELHMELGQTLCLSLHVHNTGAQPFSFTFAFHSYFPVADIRQVCVEGLDGSRCIDQLAATRTPQPYGGPVTFAGETDRIYLAARGDYRIIDMVSGGETRIKAPGCRSAIVWNPWAEKTARLGDMHPEGWQGMVCVECGNVESDRVTVGAGQGVEWGVVLG